MAKDPQKRGWPQQSIAWVIRYFSTWRELLLRPFAFVALSEEKRTRYVQPREFATTTLVLAAGLSYTTALYLQDPLYPPGITSIGSTLVLYAYLGLFVGLWFFFAVIVARARQRTPSPVPFRRLLDALVYLIVGTASVYSLAWLAIVLLFVQVLRIPSVPTFVAEHGTAFALLVIFTVSLLLAPSLLAGVLITLAIRAFYRVGIWLGIILPAFVWLVLGGVSTLWLRTTTLEKMSPGEQEVLRELYVLSDLQAAHRQVHGHWASDVEQIKRFEPVFEQLGGDTWLLWLEAKRAKSFDGTMLGYRFSFVVYSKGEECLVRAVPVDYGGETLLSFARRCPFRPFAGTLAIAQDARGGHATIVGRTVLTPPGLWYLPVAGL